MNQRFLKNDFFSEKDSMQKILRLPAVINRTGYSRSAIYLKISEGSFPAPISLGARAVGWIEADISHWIQQRIDQTRQQKGGK